MLLLKNVFSNQRFSNFSTQSNDLNARNFWTIGNDCWHKFEEKMFVKKKKRERFVIVFQKKKGLNYYLECCENMSCADV